MDVFSGQVNVMINTLNAAPSQGGRRDLLNSNVTVSCSGIQSWECDSQGNCIDGNGSGTFALTMHVFVCGCSGNAPQISEGFQTFSLPANWSIDNPDSDQTWKLILIMDITLVVQYVLRTQFMLLMDKLMILTYQF